MITWCTCKIHETPWNFLVYKWYSMLLTWAYAKAFFFSPVDVPVPIHTNRPDFVSTINTSFNRNKTKFNQSTDVADPTGKQILKQLNVLLLYKTFLLILQFFWLYGDSYFSENLKTFLSYWSCLGWLKKLLPEKKRLKVSKQTNKHSQKSISQSGIQI